jgi:diacylglycerol kinase (ATP)
MLKLISFIKNRIKAVKYAAKGFWILITTESSIIAQMVIAIAMTILGFVMQLSINEWLFQIMAIALVLVAEGINTTIEYLADYIQPKHDKKIGKLKDISAGAVLFAAIFAIIIGLIIYIPKFI